MTVSYKDIAIGDEVLVNWGEFDKMRYMFFSFSQLALYEALCKNDCAFKIISMNPLSEIVKTKLHTRRKTKYGAMIFEFPLEVLHKIYED